MKRTLLILGIMFVFIIVLLPFVSKFLSGDNATILAKAEKYANEYMASYKSSDFRSMYDMLDKTFVKLSYPEFESIHIKSKDELGGILDYKVIDRQSKKNHWMKWTNFLINYEINFKKQKAESTVYVLYFRNKLSITGFLNSVAKEDFKR